MAQLFSIAIPILPARVGVEGGTKPVGRAPEPDRTGVNGDVGVRVGSPDDLLEVYILNPDGSLQGAYVEALSKRWPRTARNATLLPVQKGS